ncbi:MAG: cation:proton antiporter, partial [Candidatus Eremiobacteraeota bacterium]|nr:cation:proton antiporter [Candidatus Eremiobacteraeota bacterium]
FKRAKVPESLSTIVQSESLLNDAMAVVLYRTIIVMTLLHSGQSAAILALVATLAGIVGALALGIAAAYLLALFVVRRNSSIVQLIATIVGAYFVYFTADIAGGSAIFAVIAFGVALREFERRSMVVDVAVKVERTWDRMALVSNAIIFFLTGAALEIGRLTDAPFVAVSALIGIGVARAILAYALTPWALGRIAPPGWLNVIRTAGARGALALALVIALPYSTENRGTIIDVTLTLVLATLVVSAFSVPRAVRSLRPTS